MGLSRQILRKGLPPQTQDLHGLFWLLVQTPILEKALNVFRVILTVYFGWSLIKGTSLFFRPESMDRLLFKAVGIEWLFWLLLVVTVAAEVVALVYLWRPFEAGYRIAQAAVIVAFLESMMSGLIGVAKPDLLKQAFIASRQERGLPVRDEILKMMDDPVLQLLPLIFAAFVVGVCLFFLYRFHNLVRNTHHLPAAQVRVINDQSHS